MIKFLTLRQFICPLSLFLKEIPFASLTNVIDVKIERVVQPIKKPVRTLSIFTSMAFVKDANGISFKNRLKGHINWRKVRNFIII